MKYEENILKEYDSEIKLMIEKEILCRFESLTAAQNSSNILNKAVRQFICTSIQQAVAEERNRIIEKIEVYYGNPKGKKMIYLDDLLSSLDKPLTDK